MAECLKQQNKEWVRKKAEVLDPTETTEVLAGGLDPFHLFLQYQTLTTSFGEVVPSPAVGLPVFLLLVWLIRPFLLTVTNLVRAKGRRL